jgi:serine/threonine protein kinase
MGEVYLAHHPRLPRQDALKVLRSDISADPDFLERFNREADLAAKLWHPHIVGIHDRGKYRGRLWISMEFVDGADVGRLLQEQYPDGMPARDAIEIVKAVAASMSKMSLGSCWRRVRSRVATVAATDAYFCSGWTRCQPGHVSTECKSLSSRR